MQSNLSSIELFTGAGGLALGLEKAGWHHLALVEKDHHACSTLQLNCSRGHDLARRWQLYPGKVQEFDYKAINSKVDLVAGGPPCQPFSLGGKHRAHQDRRDMFSEAVRAVRELRPKYFLFENVKGLTRQSFATYFSYIVLQLTYPSIVMGDSEDWQAHLSRLEKVHTARNKPELAYRVVYRLLNAADYGIPQYRHRVFLVGFRSDLDQEWSFPEPTHSLDKLLWDQWVDGSYWDEHKVATKHRPEPSPRHKKRVAMLSADFFMQPPAGERFRTVRDALFDLPDPQVNAGGFTNHEFRPGAKPYPGHTGSALDEPSKALKAGDHGVPGGENMLAFADGSYRYYTVRESARIQTFPDDYTFSGSWTESMRQIGNAVPVKLAHLVGDSIRRQVA